MKTLVGAKNKLEQRNPHERINLIFQWVKEGIIDKRTFDALCKWHYELDRIDGNLVKWIDSRKSHLDKLRIQAVEEGNNQLVAVYGGKAKILKDVLDYIYTHSLVNGKHFDSIDGNMTSDELKDALDNYKATGETPDKQG